ncbi:MAG: hypothetical protein JNK14_05720 [Chitinophagaceae bacterium]|nr:hypothetical protein [Chitinophagaceae bacterium]
MTYTPEQLISAIRSPMSVIRCGDGEAIMIAGIQAEVEWLLKRQLGYIPSPDHIEQIRHNLITAYKEADIIGLPFNKREGLSDYWYRCYDILDRHMNMGEKKTTSIDFHTDWLVAGVYEKLLNGLDSLCYISCRNLDDRFKHRYGIKNIHSFIIAPEAKFTSGYDGEVHYPNQFEKVMQFIKTIPPDTLCLVGAGVVGKIYNVWLKEAGCLSLDIGCVFDFWAGKLTRGVDRGLDKKDKTYEL